MPVYTKWQRFPVKLDEYLIIFINIWFNCFSAGKIEPLEPEVVKGLAKEVAECASRNLGLDRELSLDPIELSDLILNFTALGFPEYIR